MLSPRIGDPGTSVCLLFRRLLSTEQRIALPLTLASAALIVATTATIICLLEKRQREKNRKQLGESACGQGAGPGSQQERGPATARHAGTAVASPAVGREWPEQAQLWDCPVTRYPGKPSVSEDQVISRRQEGLPLR